MSSTVDKVKIILRFNGEWVEGNEGWDYVCTDETVEHRVKLFSNFGQMKVVYKHDGEMLMLTDDEDVSGFMEFAGNSRKPPTLFVDVDYSMCDNGGTSNTTTQEGANESQIHMSTVNPTNSHDHTYGLNDFYAYVVLETQQQQKQQADDEEEDRTTNRGCTDDGAHVFNLSFTGITLDDDEEDDEEDDDEEDDECVTLREDVNDNFEMLVFVPTLEIHTFLQNLRRVLIIDAAHLKGPYLGTMFLVVAIDGNNNIVPIAFGVEGLVFTSDRAASINAAITTIFPNSHHALCCHHLVMNVRSRDARRKVFKTLYWKACKAYTTYVFDRMMNILRVAVPDGAQLMEEVGVDSVGFFL
ncbi:hypothetical protein OSB04_002888 [Centaurea solstitialis]|uniref:MULE transposase domain-containing protein n=1 Tax=Centaurea solstitialis TaxID=347529 RepID=A0AA38UB98_9ASTR|nr:hypothetical protein OSB04_002888 [Centaurea solstitialis]